MSKEDDEENCAGYSSYEIDNAEDKIDVDQNSTDQIKKYAPEECNMDDDNGKEKMNKCKKPTDSFQKSLHHNGKTIDQQHENKLAKYRTINNYIESKPSDHCKVLRQKKGTPNDSTGLDKTNRYGYVSESTSDSDSFSGENNNSEVNADNVDNDYDELDASCLRKHKDHQRPATIHTSTYRKSSIFYKHETICGEDAQACNIDQCVSKQTNTTITTDRRSAIEFTLSNDRSEFGGMHLHSSRGSHFIEITEQENKFSSRMSLSHKDKILAIDRLPVDHYPHNIVLELLRYLLYSSAEEETSLIVERQEENGDAEILEINLKTEITECGEAPILKIKAEVCYSRTYNLGIKYVRLQNQFDCKINITGTNLYVVTDSRKLQLRTLRHNNMTKSTFTCYEFTGLMDRGGRGPNPVFIGVFQSRDNEKYIMASSKSKLSLVALRNTCMDKILRADGRFFIVSKTASGQSLFESLLYRRSFWTVKGKVLELVKDPTRNVLERQNSQFDLVRS